MSLLIPPCSAAVLCKHFVGLDLAAIPPQPLRVGLSGRAGGPSSRAMAVAGCWALRKLTLSGEWDCPACEARPVRVLKGPASGWLCAACFRDSVGRSWCGHEVCEAEAIDSISKRPQRMQPPPRTRRDDSPPPPPPPPPVTSDTRPVGGESAAERIQKVHDRIDRLTTLLTDICRELTLARRELLVIGSLVNNNTPSVPTYQVGEASGMPGSPPWVDAGTNTPGVRRVSWRGQIADEID